MINIANAQFWVHDHDAAPVFYTRKLGWEVRADTTIEGWNFRWLVVAPPGQDEIGLVLMKILARPCWTRPPALNSRSWWRREWAGRCSWDRRLPGVLRRAVGPRRGVQRPAHRAALRHRHLVPGPVGQQRPAHPDHGVLAGPGSVTR